LIINKLFPFVFSWDWHGSFYCLSEQRAPRKLVGHILDMGGEHPEIFGDQEGSEVIVVLSFVSEFNGILVSLVSYWESFLERDMLG